MDFQSLSRKDLQTLCKKNKIPANITNVAMAEALAALQEVAGIEEIVWPNESESKKSEERIDNGSPGSCRTTCRTSTRRKPVKEEPPITQSIIRTRRGRVMEMADQENKDLNISSTPSVPSNRRRAPVPSARKKSETLLIEENEEEKDQINGDQKRSDVLATPSMPKTQRKASALCSTRRKTEGRMDKGSVQGACSTRRSMRLLEKTMEKLSLIECGSIEPVVADKLFDELPERKESCEQKTNEIDSKFDDQEAVNEVNDEEEEQANDGENSKESMEMVKMDDENEEDNTTITNKAAIDEQQVFTTSCNNELPTENLSKENVISAESPLPQKRAELDIAVQREDNSETITEKTVEFNIEDLVDINVEEVEVLQYVQDSISEPKMEVQVLSDGESSLDIGELIDVEVVESELVANSIQETCNVEEQVNDSDSNDFSFPEPKIEDLRKSDEILVEDSEKMRDFSSTPFPLDQISGQFPRPKAEGLAQESRRTSLEIYDSADQEGEMRNNSNEDEEKNMSLRQLRKMVKDLTIKSNKEKTYGKEQAEKKMVRTALQPLSENCMAKDGQ